MGMWTEPCCFPRSRSHVSASLPTLRPSPCRCLRNVSWARAARRRQDESERVRGWRSARAQTGPTFGTSRRSDDNAGRVPWALGLGHRPATQRTRRRRDLDRRRHHRRRGVPLVVAAPMGRASRRSPLKRLPGPTLLHSIRERFRGRVRVLLLVEQRHCRQPAQGAAVEQRRSSRKAQLSSDPRTLALEA